MNTFPVQFKIMLLGVLTALILGIGVGNWRDRAQGGEPTDGVWWDETSQGLIAAAVEPGRAGERAGLQAGDRLLRIDDQPIPSLKEYTQRIDTLGVGARPVYTMDRPGRGQSLQVTIPIEGRSILTTTDVYRAVTAGIYLLVGIYVLVRSGSDPQAAHFYTLCLLSVVLYFYRYTTRLALFDYLVYWMSSLALLALPAAFLHFSLNFPHRSRWAQEKRWILPLIYLIPVALVLMQVRWFTGHLASIGLPITVGTRLLMDQIQLAYYAAYFAIGTALFIHWEIAATDTVARQQIRWISRSALAGTLPFLLLYGVPFLLGRRPNAYMEASLLSLSLIPLGFAYAITKYRLMDVDLLFRRGLAYLVTSGAVLGGYFLLIVFGGRLGEEMAPESGFLSIAVAALLTAFLFAPVRHRIQTKIDRLFYRERYDYRVSLLEFGKSLSAEIYLPKVADLVAQRIRQTFDIDRVAVLLRMDPLEDRYTIAGSKGLPDSPNVPLTIAKEWIGLPPAQYKILVGESLQRLGLAYLQPLRLQGKIIGLIGLGEKKHWEPVTSADVELLETLSGYAAIALENARLYKSVEQKADEYAQLQAYSDNIIESINVGVLVLDDSGRITRCNHAFTELYGVEAGQVINRRPEDLFSEDFLHAVERAAGDRFWTRPETAQVYKLVLDTRKDRDIIINLAISPLHEQREGAQGALMVFDDITQRVALEAQLLQTEKLSSIGLLAAGVAHEINTPIAGISSYTQMLLRQVADNDPKKELLSKIERQTFRASEIVNSLLNFSRLNGAEFSPLNFNSVIEETLSLLEHQFKNRRVRIETELTAELPVVRGNRGKLQQVFVNLFLNARDAMPQGGTLRIVTSAQEQAVVVEVIDTGVGIPEEHIKRIYDPFFSTKGNKGTGLGLAVSYGIVQEHGGRIYVDSRPGQGTHFTLKFPIAE